MTGTSDVRAMAVLSITRSAQMRWPVQVRIAFRNAVLADPEPFLVDGRVDVGAALIEAQTFVACWRRGTPWPPPAAAAGAQPAPTVAAPREIAELATRAAAIGIRLALALAPS